MELAFAWIGKIADWIGQWIPRWSLLDTTEAAILYRGYLCSLSLRQWCARRFYTTAYDGTMRVILCPPGIHFYWPAHSTFIAYPTAMQTDRLETQTMESSDGKTFIVSGTLTYSVEHLEMLIPTTHSAARTVVDLAMTALHDVCCDMTWEELRVEQRKGTLKTKLKNAAQRQLTEYGVKVIKLQLMNLSPARVLKISQSVASEEN